MHDGVRILPGVIERLDCWITQGREIIFLTNAPRPSAAVAKQLDKLGLPERLSTHIVSSGDAGLAYLAGETRDRCLTFLGSQSDAMLLERAGLCFVTGDQADTVICSGYDERGFRIDDYVPQLRYYVSRNVEMICLNPDKVVYRGEQIEPCAGTIASTYKTLGGAVRSFGKPYNAIYHYAIDYAGEKIGFIPQKNNILAIGDSVDTDFVGASKIGIDFLFVADGIHKERYKKYKSNIFHTPHVANENYLTNKVFMVSSIGSKDGFLK